MTRSLEDPRGRRGTVPAPRTLTVLRRPGGTPVLLSLLAVTVAVLVVVDARTPVRAALVLLFVLVGPGWAVLDTCRLARGWLGVALTVAVSLSLATVIAMAQVYAGAWSPTATVLVLVLITVTASALSLRSARNRGRAARECTEVRT